MACNIGFGIIGTGVAAHFHAKSILSIDNAHLVGIYGNNKEEAEAFASAYHTKVFPSAEALLNDDTIEAVNICTPSGLHAAYAIQGLQAGKNVIVEKPLALNAADCFAIVEAEKKSGKYCAVISQNRVTESTAFVKKAVDSGKLGKIVSTDVHMKYYRSEEYYTQSDWRGTWKMDGGGALMNQGIHGIDLMRYIMGEVHSVSAICKTLVHNIEVEDTAVAAIEYTSGALGVIVGTTCAYPGYPKTFSICGSKGSIHLEDERIVKWDVDFEIPHLDTINHGKNSPSDPSIISTTGHRKQILDLIDSIQMKKPVFYSAEDAMKTVVLICAIYESSRKGQKIILNGK